MLPGAVTVECVDMRYKRVKQEVRKGERDDSNLPEVPENVPSGDGLACLGEHVVPMFDLSRSALGA